MRRNDNEWQPSGCDSWLDRLLGHAGSKGVIVAVLILVFSGDWRLAMAIGIGTAIGFAIKESA